MVGADVVHLPVEVEGQHVPHTGVHRQVGEGEMSGGLRYGKKRFEDSEKLNLD